MNYKVKGIITAIEPLTETKVKCVPVQKIKIDQCYSGHVIVLSALGTKINLLNGFNEGENVEVDFHIRTKILPDTEYTNLIINNISRL